MEQYRKGKQAAIGFLTGQVMKAAKGKANPKLVDACSSASSGRRERRSPGRARRLLPLAWCTLLAVVFTWPLAIVLHIWPLRRCPTPGRGSARCTARAIPYLNLWILGWDLQTLSRAPLDLLDGRVFDAQIFHPARQTLAYSDHLIVVAILVWPLYALTGSAVFAYNAVLVLSLARLGARHARVRARRDRLTLGRARRRHGLGLLALPLRAPRPPAAPGDSTRCRWRARPSSSRRRAAWRAALVLGAAGAFQAATSLYYGVIGAVGAATSLVSLIVATGGRRTGASRSASPSRPSSVRSSWRRSCGRTCRCSGARASPATCSRRRGTRPRLQATSARRRPTRSTAAPAGCGPIAVPSTSCSPGRRHRPCGVGPDRGAAAGSGPLAIAAVATLAAGAVLSLGPDGVRCALCDAPRLGVRVPGDPRPGALRRAGGLRAGHPRGDRDARAHRPAARALDRRRAPRAPRRRVLPAGRSRGRPRRRPTSPVSPWLAKPLGPGAVVYLPMGGDLENTPYMLEALGHRRPIVNGYSGQRPPFFGGAVAALATFPSVEAFWMLHDLDVRFIVTTMAVDPTVWPRGRARRDRRGRRVTQRLRAGVVGGSRGAPRRAGRAGAAAAGPGAVRAGRAPGLRRDLGRPRRARSRPGT